jgi:hypothetical protein
MEGELARADLSLIQDAPARVEAEDTDGAPVANDPSMG